VLGERNPTNNSWINIAIETPFQLLTQTFAHLSCSCETLRVFIPNPQSSRSFFYSHILNVAFCTGHFPGFNRRGIPKEAGQEAAQANQREQTACQKIVRLFLSGLNILFPSRSHYLFMLSLFGFFWQAVSFLCLQRNCFFFPMLPLYSVCQVLLVSTLLFSARGRLSISLRKRGRAAADEGYITFKSLKMLK
jgi:hypothetical protein